MTTRSTGGSSWRIRRNDSRTIRFIRLRSTLRRIFFLPMTSPRRACPRSLGRARIVDVAAPKGLASSKTRLNSAARSSRALRGKPVCALRSGREPGSSLGATGSQHPASADGAHPRPKSVSALATNVAGLKCSFHSFDTWALNHDPVADAGVRVRPETAVTGRARLPTAPELVNWWASGISFTCTAP